MKKDHGKKKVPEGPFSLKRCAIKACHSCIDCCGVSSPINGPHFHILSSNGHTSQRGLVSPDQTKKVLVSMDVASVREIDQGILDVEDAWKKEVE